MSLTLRKSTMAKSKKTTPADTDEDRPGIGIPGLKSRKGKKKRASRKTSKIIPDSNDDS